MVRINGEDIAADGMNLKEYLEQNGYNMQRIAVEINEQIVSKAVYADTVLEAEDKVEVVSFVGGG
ncbi:MAG: sulfur carrier protein ThiS [Eubacteriales bacterium]|nr:sulfur carrier protein ThiS [Eubacteriales bacterium]